MMGSRWLLGAALGLALLAGPALAEEPRDEASAEELLREIGRADFVRLCASCHGDSARGDGPAASSLKKPPADLTRIAARRGGSFPTREVTSTIDGRQDVAAHGSRDMPVWGLILAQPIHEETSGEEVLRGRLQVLVEYLRSIQVK
jgi:mono/diheme cytochrome c family protein